MANNAGRNWQISIRNRRGPPIVSPPNSLRHIPDWLEGAFPTLLDRDVDIRGRLIGSPTVVRFDIAGRAVDFRIHIMLTSRGGWKFQYWLKTNMSQRELNRLFPEGSPERHNLVQLVDAFGESLEYLPLQPHLPAMFMETPIFERAAAEAP